MLNLFLNILFLDIDYSVLVNIISIITSSLLAFIAIIISIKTLKQSNYVFMETNRANIVLYFDVTSKSNSHIVVKNFGNSVGQITNIKISPELDYSKCHGLSSTNMNVIKFNNVLLAPNQSIKSFFPFTNYPDKIFKIDLYYKSLNQNFEEHYSLDITYVDNLDYLYINNKDIFDEKEALVNINNSLIRFTEKF